MIVCKSLADATIKTWVSAEGSRSLQENCAQVSDMLEGKGVSVQLGSIHSKSNCITASPAKKRWDVYLARTSLYRQNKTTVTEEMRQNCLEHQHYSLKFCKLQKKRHFNLYLTGLESIPPTVKIESRWYSDHSDHHNHAQNAEDYLPHRLKYKNPDIYYQRTHKTSGPFWLCV